MSPLFFDPIYHLGFVSPGEGSGEDHSSEYPQFPLSLVCLVSSVRQICRVSPVGRISRLLRRARHNWPANLTGWGRLDVRLHSSTFEHQLSKLRELPLVPLIVE
jgi:hypothetical protein